jgi:hypothetical protein
MAARPAGRQIALPNQTIYINNINDKLSKDLLRRYGTHVLCWPPRASCFAVTTCDLACCR